MRHLRVAAAVACVLVYAASPGVRAQQQDPTDGDRPTFRVETRVVELDVRVADRRGRLVSDLTADDFAVFENGEAREIARLSLVTLPRLAAAERRSPPLPVDTAHDIATNATGGRTFVMIIGRMGYREAPRFQWIARRFVERYLESDDRLAIIHVGYPGKNQAFTSSRALLLESIARACGRRFPSDWVQRYETCPPRGSDLGVLREVLASLGAAGGPRAHVLFISGASMSMAVASGLARTANANHATVYVLDPGGLPAGPDLTGESGPGGGGRGVIGTEVASARRFLSRETGGLAITGSNNWPAAFDRAMDDSSAYYVLAYYTAAAADDRTGPRVDVRVRRDDLSVRWRTDDTTAPVEPGTASRLPARGEVSAGLAPRLLDALRNPFPVVALPVAMFTSIFRGHDQDTRASILLGIAVDGGALGVGPDVQLELAHAIAAPSGDVQGTGRTFTLALGPDAQRIIARRGLQYFTRIQLDPGRHQLRVAASHGGVTGSVIAHVEVPDFTADPIAMSGLVLASAANDEPTLQTDAAVARILQRVPTIRRRFAPGEDLLVLGEIYVNDAALRQAVAVEVVLASDGRPDRVHEGVLEQPDTHDAGRFTYTARVPLEGLESGGYVMTVEVRSSLAVPAVRRQTRFEIEQEGDVAAVNHGERVPEAALAEP